MQQINRLESDKTTKSIRPELDTKKLVTEINMETGDIERIESSLSQVLFIPGGSILCRLDTGKQQQVTQAGFFFLAAGYVLHMEAVEDTRIVQLSIPEDSLSSQDHFFRNLEAFRKEESPCELSSLKANAIVETYIRSLDIYHCSEGGSTEFIHAKVVELFYILQFFYPQEQLGDFFRLYLTEDNRFKEQVRLHYRKARTVQELAGLLYYSYSGFNKRFKKAFGISAYSWMQRQRARMVYHELDKGCKSLKEISADYGFVSLSHFNEFCHKELGASPSMIRKKERIMM